MDYESGAPRDELLRRLEEALSKPGLNVLSGPPGSGRTWLTTQVWRREGARPERGLILFYRAMGERPSSIRVVANGLVSDFDELSDALAVLEIKENIATSKKDVAAFNRLPTFAAKMKRYKCRLVIVVDDQQWDPHEEINSKADFRDILKMASVLLVCDDDFRADLLPYDQGPELKMSLLGVNQVEGFLLECFRTLGERGGFKDWDDKVTREMARRYGRYPGLLCPAAERLKRASLVGLRGVVKGEKLLGHFRFWIPRHASAPEINELLELLYRRLTTPEKSALAALALSEIAPQATGRRLVEVAEAEALERLACDRLLLERLPAGYRIDAGVVGTWARKHDEARRLASSMGLSLAGSRFDQSSFLFWWVIGGALYFIVQFMLVPRVGWEPPLPAVVLPAVPPLIYVLISLALERWDTRHKADGRRGRES